MSSHTLAAAAATAAMLAYAPVAGAAIVAGNSIGFQLSGAGISALGMISYVPDNIAGDPVGANLITGVHGTFSDTNVGVVNAVITGLIATIPNPGNAPFATSLTHLPVLDPGGLLPAIDGSSLSYSNLFYPGGAPDTCFDGITGGFLDVFGMMLTLNNGDIAEVWSNGGGPNDSNIYGAAVASDGAYTAIDYVGGGVRMSVPEPASLGLLAVGFALTGFVGRKRRTV